MRTLVDLMQCIIDGPTVDPAIKLRAGFLLSELRKQQVREHFDRLYGGMLRGGLWP